MSEELLAVAMLLIRASQCGVVLADIVVFCVNVLHVDGRGIGHPFGGVYDQCRRAFVVVQRFDNMLDTPIVAQCDIASSVCPFVGASVTRRTQIEVRQEPPHVGILSVDLAKFLLASLMKCIA